MSPRLVHSNYLLVWEKLYSGSHQIALGVKIPLTVIAALRVAVTAGAALHEGGVVI